jgi:hypothetical protein
MDEELTIVPGFDFPLFASHGLADRAAQAAGRVAAANRFLIRKLGGTAAFTVYVLSPRDWARRAATPLYGMPNSQHGKIFLAGEPSRFWMDLTGLLPDQLAEVYGSPPDLSPFFDLAPAHELAHIFLEQAHVEFPAMWMTELFCNVVLHEYIVEQEPELLPVLETFPQQFAAVNLPQFTSRELADFEKVADMLTFAWYQCRLQVAAKRLVDTTGPGTTQRLWTADGPELTRLTSSAES